MLNLCLRDSFIELFHCNRHFSIKGKTSVTFPNFPSPGVIKLLESLSIFTCISSHGISRNEFVTATALSEELTDLFYIYEVIFLFHVLFDTTVGETSLDFFFLAKDSLFFFGCLHVFSFFFLELASSWAFFFIFLISSLFHLLRASL